MSDEFPTLAIGHNEPIPDGLPEELLVVIRDGRTRAGWCDHGKRFGDCCELVLCGPE